MIHAAAGLPLMPKAEILSVNLDGTRSVLESCAKLGVKRVVHISSTAVYEDTAHGPAPEDSPLRGVGPYGRSKVGAETLCAKARDAGLWNLFLPDSERGFGLTNLEYAPQANPSAFCAPRPFWAREGWGSSRFFSNGWRRAEKFPSSEAGAIGTSCWPSRTWCRPWTMSFPFPPTWPTATSMSAPTAMEPSPKT